MGIIVFILLCLGISAGAQDRGKGQSLRFSDGIYRSFAAFQSNRPDYLWKQLRGEWFYNPESGVTTVVSLRDTAGIPIPLDSLWGICQNGKPAIRIPSDSVNRSAPVFAQLTPLGAISYFTYEGIVRDTIEMAAYNPHTGVPFRKGKVFQSAREPRERILLFRTGEVRPFTIANVEAWTASDAELRRALGQLREQDREKLLRALEVYNQRNPL